MKDALKNKSCCKKTSNKKKNVSKPLEFVSADVTINVEKEGIEVIQEASEGEEEDAAESYR